MILSNFTFINISCCTVVDLSFPEWSSVNIGTDSDICSLQYVKVENAAREVAKLGHNAWVAKINVYHAYRNVSIHPQGQWILGTL